MAQGTQSTKVLATLAPLTRGELWITGTERCCPTVNRESQEDISIVSILACLWGVALGSGLSHLTLYKTYGVASIGVSTTGRYGRSLLS